MGFDCTTRTHVGRRRKLNEDSVLDSRDNGVWVVADGMGGHDAGEVASAMVVAALADLGSAGTFENLTAKVMDALASVNAELLQMGETGINQRIIGSTVVGLVLDESQYECFWVGDSRGYRVRNGEITRLTKDHSMVQMLIDAGMITPGEAETHPNANVITRAVGVADELEVDSVRGTLKSGDIFLLASDGLTRLITDEELCAELSGKDTEACANDLLETALERGAPDNVSFVIVRMT